MYWNCLLARSCQQDVFKVAFLVFTTERNKKREIKEKAGSFQRNHVKTVKAFVLKGAGSLIILNGNASKE